jgi:hypothetical protein
VETVFRMSRFRLPAAAVAALAALLYAIVILRSGARLSPDSVSYSRWADALISLHFNIHSFLTTQQFVVPLSLYILWILIIASSKVLLGTLWPDGIVGLNWLSATIMIYAVAVISARATKSSLIGVGSAVALLFASDILVMLPFVLSDIIFMAISTGVLLAGLLIVSETEHVRATVVTGTVLVLAASVFRPTSAPLGVYWIVCLLLAARRPARAVEAWRIVGVLGGLGLMMVAFWAVLMAEPSRWPATAGAAWIQQLSGEAHHGVVVFGRPETYLKPPSTAAAFTVLTLTKFTYYFAPWLTQYSGLHKGLNAVFFLPVYLLSLVAIFRSNRWRLTTMLVLYIGAFALFHATQQIDFDHRYRLPILPALTVLAALGLNFLYRIPPPCRRRPAV